ncbi:hypothetical protein ABTN09_20585, partial [Acinetobacter baumannii]
DANKNELLTQDATLQKDNLLMLTSPTQGWLFYPNTLKHQGDYSIIGLPWPLNTSAHTLHISPWQIEYWFVMQNNQGGYGLYRLQPTHE